MPGSKWDEQFQTHKYAYGKEANEFIRQKSHIYPDSSHIACFAEGEGRNAVFLAKQGHTVTAYDYSKVGLTHTKEFAEKNRVDVKTVHADLTVKKVEPDTYDGALFVYGHVPKKDQPFFVNNIISSVKKGGYVLFEVYSEKQLNYDTGGPKNIDLLYKPEHILQWIEPYTCKHFFYGEKTRYEGAFHTGVGHVIQCVIQT